MCISHLTRARSSSVLFKISFTRFCKFLAEPSNSVNLAFISAGTNERFFATLSPTSLRTLSASSVIETTSFASSSLNFPPASMSNSNFSTPCRTFANFSSLPSTTSLDFSNLSAAPTVFLAFAISCCAAPKRNCNCASAPARPPHCFFSRAFSAIAFFASVMAAAAARSACAQLVPAPLRSSNGVSAEAPAKGDATSTNSRTFPSQATRASKAGPNTAAYFFSKVDDAMSVIFFDAASTFSVKLARRSNAALEALSAAILASAVCFLINARACMIAASPRLCACSTAVVDFAKSVTSPPARKGASAFS
mmetsp:Transcript_12737/g.36566  ORF Transcript_12737/g.36566 Transcript_12737/m.36566 type:complete len:308 (-) Transcript_12737:1549-2472(-)